MMSNWVSMTVQRKVAMKSVDCCEMAERGPPRSGSYLSRRLNLARWKSA
jgi:hypothetical protein